MQLLPHRRPGMARCGGCHKSMEQESERMTFRVMAGISAIWAGNTRELKDGTITMPGTKYDVTEDVLGAAAVWLDTNKIEEVIEMKDGRRIILKVEIEDVKE